MKFLATLALSAAVLMGASTMARAQADQAAPPRGQRGGMMSAALLKGIDLSAAQKAKIDSIQTSYRSQMPAMTPGSRPDEATRAKRREIMQKESADIRAVLTSDQQKVYDKNLEEMRSRMQRRGPGGPR